MDKNLEFVLGNLREAELVQLQELAEGSESDNRNQDSNLEQEQ